jgi:formate/nitrite transporter
MSYLKPADLVTTLIDAGQSKIFMSARDTFVRAIMGGALLTIAAAFAVTVSVTTGFPLLGALLFPVGFIMLYLLGYDLLTGVFILGPLAWLDRRPGVTLGGVLRNWGLVFAGNFVGAFTVAVLMAIVVTYGFSTTPNEVGVAIGHIGESRTVGYAEHGLAGMLTLFIRGVLCNWMVSTGVAGAMMAKSVPGKAIAMWMPIMLFFFMGFEHSIVNMFLFPSGLLLGGDFTVLDYLLWNEIPTILGNLVGGLLFVALPLYFTHARTKAPRSADRRVVGDPLVVSGQGS